MSEDPGATGRQDHSTASWLDGVPNWAVSLVPIVLLLVVLGLFVLANPLAGVESGEPLPDVSVTYVEIPNSEIVVAHVINNGPEPVTISQVLVDEAYWDFRMEGAGGDRTLAPMQQAKIVLPYHTTPGFDYEIALVTASGATFHHHIVAAQQSPGVGADLLWTFVVIGLFVGFIPVVIGMLWFPAMQRMSDRAMHGILAFSAGILGFLAFDAGFEAFEIAEEVPGAYDGHLLIVLGIVGATLIVQAVMDRASADRPSALVIAYGVALGIGLHNLAEGLAIGSSFALGRASLGAFLVIGFMIHNVTEGPAIVAPVARGERPALGHFAAMGAIAGLPTIAGGWIGSIAFSPTIGVLFLAIGVGALLQVIYDIGGIIDRDGRLGTGTNLMGFLVGFVVMYATDFLVTV